MVEGALVATVIHFGEQVFEWRDLCNACYPNMRATRLWVFGWIFAGYLVYYLNRGSFTFTAPFIRQELGWSLQQVCLLQGLGLVDSGGRIAQLLFPITTTPAQQASQCTADSP
jgi:hypothetical protein